MPIHAIHAIISCLFMPIHAIHAIRQKKKEVVGDEEDANALKRNVEMTEHKENIEELLGRLKTNVDTGLTGECGMCYEHVFGFRLYLYTTVQQYIVYVLSLDDKKFKSDKHDLTTTTSTCKRRKRSALKRDQSLHSASPIMQLRATTQRTNNTNPNSTRKQTNPHTPK